MALFSPKYPEGAEPQPKKSRREKRIERWEAEVRARKEITEEQLRELEQAGCRVERRSKGVVVYSTTPGGGHSQHVYPALGNGRYWKG